MSLERIAQFGACVVGSGCAGQVGSFLVWNCIYSLGSRVGITDELHEQHYETVIAAGAVVGVLFGLATVPLVRQPAPVVLIVVLAAGHGFAVIAGCVGGCDGWRQGLWAYFGGLAVFTLCLALRRMFHVLEPKLRRAFADGRAIWMAHK